MEILKYVPMKMYMNKYACKKCDISIFAGNNYVTIKNFGEEK